MGHKGFATAVVAAVCLTGAAWALSAPRTQGAALGPGKVTVELGIRHSRFSSERLVVRSGSEVTFVVANSDPIGHELIVGGPEVHARHRSGREPSHPAVPGEVSVGPGSTALTSMRFESVGSFAFACHLPGHFEYGMHGLVVVVP